MNYVRPPSSFWTRSPAVRYHHARAALARQPVAVRRRWRHLLRQQGPVQESATVAGSDLGFFDWSAIGSAVQQIAPAAAQVYAQKLQLDTQRKIAEAQARAQQQAAMAAMQQPQYGSAPPSYHRGAGIGDGLPSWVLPVGLGGAALLAVMMLRR